MLRLISRVCYNTNGNNGKSLDFISAFMTRCLPVQLRYMSVCVNSCLSGWIVVLVLCNCS